jgi:hypothetical protein
MSEDLRRDFQQHCHLDKAAGIVQIAGVLGIPWAEGQDQIVQIPGSAAYIPLVDFATAFADIAVVTFVALGHSNSARQVSALQLSVEHPSTEPVKVEVQIDSVAHFAARTSVWGEVVVDRCL